MSDSTPPIELAKREDVPAMLAIANHAAQHTAANFATEPEPESDWLTSYDKTRELHPWLVIREQGQVIGFAKSSPYRVRGAYRFSAEVTIYIRPEWHGRGLGKALYNKLIPTLRAQGYVSVFAGITSPHPPSESLHQGFGFKNVGVFHRCGWKFNRWHDVGFWELSLASDAQPAEVKKVAEVWTNAAAESS